MTVTIGEKNVEAVTVGQLIEQLKLQDRDAVVLVDNEHFYKLESARIAADGGGIRAVNIVSFFHTKITK